MQPLFIAKQIEILDKLELLSKLIDFCLWWDVSNYYREKYFGKLLLDSVQLEQLTIHVGIQHVHIAEARELTARHVNFL